MCMWKECRNNPAVGTDLQVCPFPDLHNNCGAQADRPEGMSLRPLQLFLLHLWLVSAICWLLLPAPASAAIQWSASAVAGYYSPRLDELNYILRNQAVELGPRNTEAKPTSYPG